MSRFEQSDGGFDNCALRLSTTDLPSAWAEPSPIQFMASNLCMAKLFDSGMSWKTPSEEAECSYCSTDIASLINIFEISYRQSYHEIQGRSELLAAESQLILNRAKDIDAPL